MNNTDSLNKSQAAIVLIPLLDALNWKGDNSKLLQSMVNHEEDMDTDDLIDTMSNLNFQHHRVKNVKFKNIDKRSLPLLFVWEESYLLIINMDDEFILAFDSLTRNYKKIKKSNLSGDVFSFKYVGEITDSLLHEQNNWFNKLLTRFTRSLKTLTLLTFLMTMLDLLIPMFVILIYGQIASSGSTDTLIILLAGVLLYFVATFSLEYYRSLITNYVSVRMGSVISQQTFRKLLYLPPGYTETASISSQINRMKDFENLKRFTNSGIFVNLLELIFSVIYIIAMFVLGGWVGFVPIITAALVLSLGFIMRPFHKVRMEQSSIARAERQQNLLEIFKNTEEIKTSGMKEHWIERSKNISATSIYKNFIQSDYIYGSNNIIYFITNASVIVVIYGGVLRVFEGNLSMGGLVGIVLIYWKVLASIRGASSLFVQVNGLTKSINQINRFMKLPQDTNLKANMVARKDLFGKVAFQDVSIRYNQTSKAALINVNFNVESGEIMGICGHDGAGKTTILKLIMGMYIPQGGRIMIDSNNIKQLEPLRLRKSISYSPERDLIFEGTIRSNFKNVNPSLTDERIQELMEETNMCKYMKAMSYKMDTYLTEDIIHDLSPSFKKIMCITRMLSRDVQLYLLDEPENHLDNEELDNLVKIINKRSFEDKASFIITSKSDKLLRNCHQKIKLNQGRVVQVAKKESENNEKKL